MSNLSVTRGKLSWAIFTPSPTAVSASQSVALRSWLNLRIPPKVYLVVHDDRDAAGTSMVDQELGIKTLTIKSNVKGVPQVCDVGLEPQAVVSIGHIDRVPIVFCCDSA